MRLTNVACKTRELHIAYIYIYSHRTRNYVYTMYTVGGKKYILKKRNRISRCQPPWNTITLPTHTNTHKHDVLSTNNAQCDIKMYEYMYCDGRMQTTYCYIIHTMRYVRARRRNKRFRPSGVYRRTGYPTTAGRFSTGTEQLRGGGGGHCTVASRRCRRCRTYTRNVREKRQ